MSTVRMNEAGIRTFFQSRPFAGTSLPGLRTNTAARIAARMVLLAEREVGATFHKRTGELAASLRPIVRVGPGGTEVGVGSTAPHAEYLEYGTVAHEITPHERDFLVSTAFNPMPLRGRRLRVSHPGNPAFGFLNKAVNLALGRTPTRLGLGAPLR